MIAAVRQTVKVQAEGRIEIVAPELRIGEVTEVIVLLPNEPPPQTPAERAAAFARLQKSFGLTEAAADEWIHDVRRERDAWRRPTDSGK